MSHVEIKKKIKAQTFKKQLWHQYRHAHALARFVQ
jgi:hypothetical protein